MTQVSERAVDVQPVAGRRTRRRTVPALAVVSTIALVMAVGAAVRLAGQADGRGDTGPVAAVAGPRCPAEKRAETTPPQGARRGPLLSVDAVGATLCTYAGGGAVLALERSADLTGDLEGLVAYLNALPDSVGEDVVGACLLMQRPEYMIVFGYPQAPTERAVQVSPNCATAAHDGGVRYLTSVADLLAFWPA